MVKIPYIKKEDRRKFDIVFQHCQKIETKGELEYVVFKFMQRYMVGKEYRYSTLHDCVYAVQHCADEYRRRFLDVREDRAREENGII